MMHKHRGLVVEDGVMRRVIKAQASVFIIGSGFHLPKRPAAGEYGFH